MAIPKYLAKINFYFFKDFIYLFLERGEERERNVIVWLPLMYPLLGTGPATQVCALTGNQTNDPLLCSLALNPLTTPARAGNNKFLNNL